MKRVLVAIGIASMLGAACGGAPGSGSNASASPGIGGAARADLAPTGRLRLAFPASPPFLGQQDPQSGKWKGLAITMGNALAAQLGVSLVPIQSPGPAQTYQALQSGSVDVALAQLQLKPDGVSSTGAVVSVEHTFLVRADSALKSVADVDRQGIKIGGVGSEGHTAILGSRLQHAQLVRFNSDAQGLAALAAGQIDAYASGRFALVDMSSQIPGSRILDGSFFTPMLAFATLSSRSTGAAFLNTFAVSELSTGQVQRDIDAIVARPGVVAGPPA